MIPRLGDGNGRESDLDNILLRLENDSPSRGRKLIFGLDLIVFGFVV